MTESPLMRVGAALASVTGSNADVERSFATRQRMMKDYSRSKLEENKWHKMALLKANLRLFDERLVGREPEQYVYIGESACTHVSESESGVQGLSGTFDHLSLQTISI